MAGERCPRGSGHAWPCVTVSPGKTQIGSTDIVQANEQVAPAPAALHKPLARLLRPLVRLCIHSGITYPTLCDLLRELFVSVVENDFALPEKQQTDSRVSLLTGIHRKEVRRFRDADMPSRVPGKALSRTARILARWMATVPFVDERGQPLPLPRVADNGAPSFESLVGTVTRDIRSRAVLDDWLDRELVAIDGNDLVRLRVEALIPKAGDEQQLFYFARNLHDHAAAAVDNVVGRTAPFFERAAHYDGLSEAAVRHLEARARKIATEALLTANREAHRIGEADAGGAHRWTFGLYIYRTEEGPDTDGDDTGERMADAP